MTEELKIRINKFLSEVGYCSRRKADVLIEQARIKINDNMNIIFFNIVSFFK